MIGAILLFSSLNFSNLSPNVDVSKIVDSAGANVPMEIATDPGFSQKTQNFGQGQTVYVRITTGNDGSGKHNLNVHDSEYNVLSTYQMRRSGDVFTVDFAAPKAEGTYSLEADIESSGSNLSLVKTITVGGGNSSSNVKVENLVGAGSSGFDKVSGSPSALPSPGLSPEPGTKAHKVNVFSAVWRVIFGLFKKIF